jgi:hypothetical protein
MLRFRRLLVVPCILLIFAGCSRPSTAAREPGPQASTTAEVTPQKPIAFEDRVWRVPKSSAVQRGTLYLFRSNGSLEITSPGSKVMIGSWSRTHNGLVMIEESIPYQVDILSLTPDSFIIRSHNPGRPVDINMVPAASPEVPAR